MTDFSGDLFVDRKEIGQILDWISENPGGDRGAILALVSPPGTGKSWLMQAALKRIDDPQLIILSLDIPEYQKGGELDVDKIKDWVSDAYTRARGLKVNVTFNPTTDITHSIDYLVEAIEQRRLRLLVVQDGYDEVEKAVRFKLDSWVSWHFIRRPCVKILTAFRSGCLLEHFSVKKQVEEFPLQPPGMNSFAVDQFKKLYLNEKEVEPNQAWIDDCNVWMEALGYYQWDHPYINRYLFENAWDDGELSLFNEPVFIESIKSTVSRPDKGDQYPSLSEGEFILLKSLAAELDRTWLMSDYESAFGVVAGHDTIDPLLNKGVVEHVRGTQRYQIVPGIYELLLEIRHSQRKG